MPSKFLDPSLRLGSGANATIDAFSRARVSNPFTIFESKAYVADHTKFWDDAEMSGGGTSSAHQDPNPAMRIGVSNTTAGRRTRRTLRHFQYQAGKSQLVLMTGVMGAGGTGINQRIGAFSETNGLYFECNEGTIQVVERTYTSGSVVETAVTQANWNLDKLDGTGPSGFTLDLTKTQIFLIDYQWLGVGRVRYGFDLDGDIIYCHETVHANVLTVPYTATGSLPLSYEIENDGTGAAATMDCICTSLQSEGGQQPVGDTHNTGTEGSFINANTAGTIYLIAALRLKTTHPHAEINLQSFSVLPTGNNNVFEWEVFINPTIAGTPTWNDPGTDHGYEYAIGDVVGNPSATTITNGTEVLGGYGYGRAEVSFPLATRRKIGIKLDGTQEVIALGIRAITANVDIYGTLNFTETL